MITPCVEGQFSTNDQPSRPIAGVQFPTSARQMPFPAIFGIKVPVLRKLSKEYMDLSLKDLKNTLKSKYHEERLLALLIMVGQFSKGDQKKKKSIHELYLKNTRFINNWDLVDVTTPKIVGEYLLDKPKQRKILYKLAKSKDLWERRVSIMATFTFIRANDFQDALKLSEILLNLPISCLNFSISKLVDTIVNSFKFV